MNENAFFNRIYSETGKKSTRWKAFFMKKLGKGIIIGTAVVVLGSTAVFASGFGNGAGGQGRAAAATESAPSWQGDGMYCTDADGDGICDYHQDGSCHYADTDRDGICDYHQDGSCHYADTNGDGVCDYHQDGSCQYTDTDGDGVCDHYQEKISSGLASGGHHGAGHHGGRGNCHN